MGESEIHHHHHYHYLPPFCSVCLECFKGMLIRPDVKIPRDQLHLGAALQLFHFPRIPLLELGFWPGFSSMQMKQVTLTRLVVQRGICIIETAWESNFFVTAQMSHIGVDCQQKIAFVTWDGSCGCGCRLNTEIF